MFQAMQAVNSHGVPQTLDDLAGIGAAVAVSAGGGGSDTLLRLMKDGSWAFGADNTEPLEGSEWAINPYSFRHGFIAWLDGKVAGEVMVPVTHPLPSRGSLGEVGGPWDDQLSFSLMCAGGEDEGITVAYKTTSVGGRRACAALATEISMRARARDEEIVPVVTLGSEHYQHKQYGRIYTPVFEIVRWVTIDGVSGETPAAAAPAEVKAAPAVEAAPAPEAPKTRQRRR